MVMFLFGVSLKNPDLVLNSMKYAKYSMHALVKTVIASFTAFYSCLHNDSSTSINV